MICGLSTGWKWSERSLCSAGLVRRIWLSRVMSGASESGLRRFPTANLVLLAVQVLLAAGAEGTFSHSSKAGP